ncbi:hypothetical protein [Lysobacter sp. ESA13C]|uniref:hypothetical protein n=1 Tax=Lysobacter sp. ESA13C TaxID=2862676 RepID=UPI001CBB83B8|nr:hypothetical protein [Lysobacter sp. ESA13C]
MATDGNQKSLPLAFGAANTAPKDAPARVLRLIETEAQALAVSIRAGHHKLEYIAAVTGKSKAYISRLQTGRRPIPRKLVDVLCAATGSNLLRQFLDLQAALDRRDACQVSHLAGLLRAA